MEVPQKRRESQGESWRILKVEMFSSCACWTYLGGSDIKNEAASVAFRVDNFSIFEGASLWMVGYDRNPKRRAVTAIFNCEMIYMCDCSEIFIYR